VKNTASKQPVFEETVFVCNLTNEVKKVCGLDSSRAYLNTKILKHLYDKKPAEEFDFIIRNVHTITKYPDKIYKNRASKRGAFCLVKKLKGDLYFCSIEVAQEISLDGFAENRNYIVTCFRLRNENYLKNYELLWSWKGGVPSS